MRLQSLTTLCLLLLCLCGGAPGQNVITTAGARFHYPEGMRQRTYPFIEAWVPAKVRLRGLLGRDLDRMVDVELVRNFTALQDRVESLSQHLLPTWVGGVAIGADRIIIRLDLGGTLRRRVAGILIHELAHILVHQALDHEGATPCPRWLDEGIAQVAEGRVFVPDAPSLPMRAFFGQIQSFEELEKGFPRGEGASAIAYAQSESFVQWILRLDRDVPMLGLIIQSLRDGSTVDESLRRLLGHPVSTLEAQWIDSLQSDKSWVASALGKVGFGLLVLFAVIMGASRIVRRKRELEARWEEEELIVRPLTPEEILNTPSRPLRRLIEDEPPPSL